MSVVSKYGDVRIVYPNRRVYTAPIQTNNMVDVEYLNPENLNLTRREEYVNYSLPSVLPGQNVYDPTRRPSENLTIHMDYIPLQYMTEGDREGSSRFHAGVSDPMPKLRTKADKYQRSYAKNMTKEDISFSRSYGASADYGDHTNMARLIRGMRPDSAQTNKSFINEPVGDTFRETFTGSKAHRVMNAPASDAQEELEFFYRTGRWI